MADKRPEILSGFISSDEEQIYYESTGEGEAIIFCHGLGGNHANWFQQVPFFAQSYRCITWDQRGFGQSTNYGGVVTPALAINDLKRLIDQLGLTSVHQLATMLPNAQFVEIPETGHSPYFEDPTAWNHVVWDFFASN